MVESGFIQKIATIFQGLFKDHVLDFQGPPTASTRNIFSQILQKCTFQVYSCKTFAWTSPTSLHFQFTCLKFIVTKCNYCIQHWALCVKPLNSLSYDSYSVLDNQKALKNTFQATTFKDFSRLCEPCW